MVTIAAHYTKYSLLVPTPDGVLPSAMGGPHDEWVTVSTCALWCTCLLAVMAIHVWLLVHLTLKDAPGLRTEVALIFTKLRIYT